MNISDFELIFHETEGKFYKQNSNAKFPDLQNFPKINGCDFSVVCLFTHFTTQT
jgi:hypothetical protein